MKEVIPKVREVRVIAKSLGHDIKEFMFNDKREGGRRIKIWGKRFAQGDMITMQNRLQLLFPNYKLSVYTHKNNSTCIRFTKI